MLDQHPELGLGWEHRQRFWSSLLPHPPPPTGMWESPSTAPAFHLVNSSRKRDAFSCLISVWRGRKGVALPPWQHCSLLCVGCPTYSCLSRQVPGFLLQQNRTFTAVFSFFPRPILGICSHAAIEIVFLLANPYLEYRIQSLKYFKSLFFFVQSCKVAEESKC